MPKIAIVTDSTSDLPEELIKKYDISVIPLTVHFGHKEFVDDGKDLTLEDFFIKLKESDVFPTTSQPSPGDFIELYRRLLKSHNSIISIHISNKLSATIGSALLAKKDFPGKDITIIDTLAAHAPLGLIVLKAAQMNSEGISKDEIVAKVNEMIKKVKAFILPKTLENLKRGGRIGKARGLLASLLDIKPILTLTPDGHIGIFKTTRRWSKAKRMAVESIGDFITGDKDLIVTLSDANATEDVEEVEAEIRALYSPKKIMKVKIGIVVGTHVGTGIGITFYEE
ncbi:MAG: DegV family protein [Actinobacteria bacterium]|nr:DegV family protein [Actinomycetota bacterium]